MENFLKTNYKKKVVIDVSAFPDLKTILSTQTDLQEETLVFIPDTFKKLLGKAKDDPNYYEILTRLVSKWTNKQVDFNFLEKIIKEGKYENVTIKTVGVDEIDQVIYRKIFAKVKSKDLEPKFSEPFNLLGDVVGKIIGIAKSLGAYILMRSKKLVNLLRDTIPVFLDSTDNMKEQKVEFFENFFPQLRRTRGLRWFIAIAVSGITFVTTEGNPIGITSFVLTVFDP